MINRSNLRDTFGECYSTIVDENTIIPWRPLDIGSYIKYDSLLRENTVSVILLEDEIFKICVLDKEVLRNFDSLPAGLVSCVVQNIMEYSGPISIDHFNNLLEDNRIKIQAPLHALINTIIRAFPAYKPEDIYSMSFEVFMMRVAQAESMLLEMGIIKQPIELIDNATKPKKQRRKINNNQLKEIWEKQNLPKKQNQSPIKTPQFENLGNNTVKVDPDKSPIFMDGNPKTFKNLDKDRVDTERSVGSEEENEIRAKLVKDAQKLYKPILDKLDFYKKQK